MGFNFVQTKGPALFQGEIIIKKRKCIDEIKKFFSRSTEIISTNLGTKHPWVWGIQVSSNEKTINYLKVHVFFLLLINVIIIYHISYIIICVY